MASSIGGNTYGTSKELDVSVPNKGNSSHSAVCNCGSKHLAVDNWIET